MPRRIGGIVLSGTAVMGDVAGDGAARDDFTPTRHTGFWPHLDRLIDLDRHMQANGSRGTQMVTLRLGHFLGTGNRLGLLPVLAPRLRTARCPGWRRAVNGCRSVEDPE